MTRIEHRSNKTGGSDLWQSPELVLDLVRHFGPIITDPCTAYNNPTKAQVYYTIAENGLKRPWFGLTYANPPYSQTKHWMAKASYECSRNRGVEVIALIAARTGARWFSPMFDKDALCLWFGRLKFKGAKHCAPFDSALVYFGPRRELFTRTFSPYGAVLTKHQDGEYKTCLPTTPLNLSTAKLT